MKLRKKGETYKQLLRRMEEVLNQKDNIIKTQDHMLNNGMFTNPRTGRLFSEEAQFMFTTLSLIEIELRGTDCNQLVLGAVRETLEQLGFNIVDQYENKCIKDGAYTNA